MSEERAAGADPVVGRLAPTPTGLLHLGNARSFLLAWWSARRAGGRVLLRIEDIDGARVREGAVEAALEDLRWLGVDHDGEPLVQSARREVYDRAVERLLAAGRAYPCVCSRKEVAESASAPHESWQDAPVYPGTCRGRFRDLEDARARTGREPAVRFLVEEEAVPFEDGFLGPQPGLVRGDFVIRRKDGGPSYQLAVTVDDAATGVNEVVRGDDLVVSTPRQLLLYRALGLEAPRFVHVPLVLDASGERLAKRNDATAMRWYREHGLGAERMVGYLAWASGLTPDPAPRTAASLVESFRWDAVRREPLRIDEARLGEAPG